MFEDVVRALYQTFFNASWFISSIAWGLDSVLLYLAYMLNNVRGHLVLHVFSPVLDVFMGSTAGAGGALVGIIRASFFFALLVLGLSYIARPFFPTLKIVDPGKLLLWGGLTVMLMGTGAASSLYQNVEAFRDGLSGTLRAAVLSDAIEDPSQLADYFDPPGRVGPSTYPVTDTRGIAPIYSYVGAGEPEGAPILGYDIACAFLRASIDDVIHPIRTIPEHLDWKYYGIYDGRVSFFGVFWRGMLPVQLSLDAETRGNDLSTTFEGIVRLLLGIVLCIFAVLEAFIMLCLTIATGVIFCTLPVALIFAYFEYTAPIAGELIKSYINVFVKTMMISVLFAIIALLLLVGAMVGNAVVVVGVGVIGVLFGINYSRDGLDTVLAATKSFSRSLGQVAGVQPAAASAIARRIGGAVKTAGGMATTGTMGLLSGAGLAGAAGMALGASRSAYTVAAGAAAAGWGRRGGALTRKFQQGMLTAGMTGGRVMSPVVFRQMYQQRQARRAESAAEKYKAGFEEYQGDLEKQRQAWREGRAEQPEMDKQLAAWKAGAREEPPELPEHLQRLAKEAREELDAPFMGGYLARGFASTLPRPTEKGMPTLRDLFPGEQGLAAAVAGGGGGGGGGVGALGGEPLGDAARVGYADVMERLASGMVVGADAKGNVEAIRSGEVPPPESSFVVSAAAMNPNDLLGQGYSLALEPDGERVRVWKPVFAPAESESGVVAAARQGVQRRQRVGQSSAGRGAPAAPQVAVGDAPAIPLAGPLLGGAGTPAIGPTPATHPEHAITVSGSLAATMRRVFSQRPSSTGAGPGAAASIVEGIMGQKTRVKAIAGNVSGEAGQELRRKLGSVVAGSLQELRSQGMADPDIGLLVRDAEGKVRGEFADYALQRATAEGGLLAAEPMQQVGMSPQAEEEFALTGIMGGWARHPNAAMATAVREGMRASRVQGAPAPLANLLPPTEAQHIAGVSVGQYSVATAMQTVVEQATAEGGVSHAAALSTLAPQAGVAADQVYRCMETYGAAQSISVVQQTEQVVREMAEGGMQASDILHTVYTPTGDVRPEFLEVVVGGSQDGASAFVRTAAGRQDLQTLIGAGLGSEVTIGGPTVVNALGQSLEEWSSGVSGPTVGDVASRLGVPSTAFRNAVAPLNSFMASAHQVGLQPAEVQGIVQAATAGHVNQGFHAQLVQRLTTEKGLTPEAAAYTVDQLHSLARSAGVSGPLRAPRVLGSRGTPSA